MSYEEKCLALDKQLAELLGWHRIVQTNPCGNAVKYSGDNILRGIVHHPIPRWTQDDAEALRLVVEHQCLPCQWDDESIACGINCAVLDENHFPDKLSCVRYAIVQAVINKLKG